jgi:hypothetical protein
MFRYVALKKVIKKGRDYYLKELKYGRAKLMSLRARAAKYPELECALLSWIKKCMIDFRHRDLNITRYAVCIMAQLIAKDMKILNFHASRNWFQAFRRRHDLSFGRKRGESGSVQVHEQRLCKSMDKLRTAISLFDPNSIFNMDETGLYYQQTGKRTCSFTCFKSELVCYVSLHKCRG